MLTTANLRPGSRLVVKYFGQAGWHERLVLGLIRGLLYLILTPDGDKYAEELSDYETWHDISGMMVYPRGVNGYVHAFSEPLTNQRLKAEVVKARRSCVEEQRNQGYTVQGATHFLDWNGTALELPAPEGRLAGLFAPTAEPVRRKRAARQPPIPLADASRLGAAVMPSASPLTDGVAEGVDPRNEPSRGLEPPRGSEPLGGEVNRLAPEGYEWIMMDTEVATNPSSGLSFGETVHLLPGSQMARGSLVVGEVKPGLLALCRLVAVSDIPEVVRRAQGLFPTEGMIDLATHEVGGEDARTLWIDRERVSKNRFKDFRVACDESYQESHADTRLKGKPNALHFCRTMAISHSRPSAWLLSFSQRKHMEENDRNLHELSTLMQIIEEAGEVDQLNLGGVVCIETATRRAAAIADALKNGVARANWAQANEIMSLDRDEDLLGPERREEVTRNVEARLRIERLRQATSSAYRGASVTEKDDLIGDGSLPSASPAAPLSRKAKAKVRARAAGGDGS